MAILSPRTTITNKSQAQGDAFNYYTVVYDGGAALGPETFVMPQGGYVSSVKYSTRAILSDGTNYETVTVTNERSASTVVVAGTPLAIWSDTFTLGDVETNEFLENDVLSVASVATGAGVADGCVVIGVQFK